MALMPGRLYDALRAAHVPDDKARKAAEEVANYEGKLTRFRLEMGERIGRVEWMVGFLVAAGSGMFALQWQILLRLPS